MKQIIQTIQTRSFWQSAAYELLLFLTAGLLIFGWSTFLDSRLPDADSLLFQGVVPQNFGITFWITSALLIVLLLLNYAFWKNLIWSRLLGKPMSRYSKFTLLTGIWWIVLLAFMVPYFTAAFAYLQWAGQSNSMAFATIAIIINYLFILPVFIYILAAGEYLQYFFIKDIHYIKQTLNTIKDLKKLYLPLVVLGVALSIVTIILQSFPQASTVLSVILIPLYFAGMRQYLVTLL